MQELDEILVKKSLQGDKQSFAQLIARHSHTIISLAFARIGNMHDMEDILQESTLRAWCNLERLRDKKKFAGWFYGIAQWVCHEKIRQRRVVTVDMQDFELPALPDEIFEKNQQANELTKAIQNLPLIYREAVVLLYFENKSYQQIAEILGISKAGVNFRLNKARKMLRKFMKEGE